MKRDGRTLDHGTLEEFRLLALRRVREGEKPSDGGEVARDESHLDLPVAEGGVWSRQRSARFGRSRPATGRPSKLTPAQRAQVFRWINGKDPRQYGLDFGLWTRQIAATLIEQKFGVQPGRDRSGQSCWPAWA